MQLHPFSVCFSNVLPSVLDHSAVCLPSSVGELNEPEIVLVIILDAPRAEHCFIFRNHTLLISFWCFSSKPPRRRHSVCLSQLFPWRQLLFQEVLAPFVFRQRWWRWRQRRWFSRERKHDEASESQGLKVQTSKFTCWTFFPVVGNVTPICSQHSIIRRRLWTRYTARAPKGAISSAGFMAARCREGSVLATHLCSGWRRRRELLSFFAFVAFKRFKKAPESWLTVGKIHPLKSSHNVQTFMPFSVSVLKVLRCGNHPFVRSERALSPLPGWCRHTQLCVSSTIYGNMCWSLLIMWSVHQSISVRIKLYPKIFAGGCKQRAKYCCFDELFRVFCRELPSPINASTYGLGGSNYIHVHTQSGLDWLLSLLQTHSVINYNHGSFARHLKIYSRRCISENARVPCIYIVWNV